MTDIGFYILVVVIIFRAELAALLRALAERVKRGGQK